MPTETLVIWFFGLFPRPLDSPLAKTTRHNPGILSFVGIPSPRKERTHAQAIPSKPCGRRTPTEETCSPLTWTRSSPPSRNWVMPARPCESACGCWATSHGGSDGKAWHSPICMSQLADQFLEGRRREGRLRSGDASTVRHFLEHLRERGAIRSPEPAADESPLATLRRQYANHLEKERGLAAVTVAGYWPFIRRLRRRTLRGRADPCPGTGPGRHRAVPPATRPLGQPQSRQADGDGPALLLPVPLPARTDRE